MCQTRKMSRTAAAGKPALRASRRWPTRGRRLSLVLGLLVGGLVLGAWASEQFNLDKLVQFVGRTYDESAQKRVVAWRRIIDQGQDLDETAKLEQVNRFFNLFDFVDDIDHWQQEDYWATPIEFIGTRGGDCEDFSIAKYFTLVEMGVPVEKLRLTYVKAVSLDQFHMVLAYYPNPKAIPVILDNLDGEIKPANLRRDLIPIFSFNGQKLWLNKQKGRGQVVGGSERLANWTDLGKRYQLSEYLD